MRLPDASVRTDDISDPSGVLRLLRITRAVGETDRPVGVAKQRKLVLELLRKGVVVGNRVETDAQYDRSLLQVLGMEVAEPATFEASAGSIGLRIEPKDDILPFVVGQPNDTVLVILDRETWGRVTNLEHPGPPEQLDDRRESHAP